ncbi:hypothetical protein BWI17_18065 [Betaproteobacteria bacterium GR16-43]|nr:hypothetical protein BWI17_18065 [Betaproteobacteria bacterium GR16-43]
MAAAPQAAKNAAKGAEAPAAPAPKKGGKKLLVIAIVGLLLGAGAGGAAWYFLGSKKDKEAHGAEGKDGKEAKKSEPTKVPVFLPLDTFTVNLRDNQSERYLQAGLTLEVEAEPAAERLKAHMPIARSAILLLLSSKQSNDLNTVEDKAKLGTEIIAELAKIPAFKEVPVRAVHFHAFVIQ